MTTLAQNSSEKYQLMAGAICTECSEARARAVVAVLQQHGWNIEFGGMGRGSILPKDNPQFSADFYSAIDEVG